MEDEERIWERFRGLGNKVEKIILKISGMDRDTHIHVYTCTCMPVCICMHMHVYT